MPTKKTRGGVRAGSKTALILEFPSDMPAKDVVVQAAKRGVKLTEKYVYNMRSAHRGAVAQPKRGPGRPPKSGAARKAKPGRRRGRPPAATGNLEARLRGAIAELGLARARAVLDEVATAFGG